MMTKVLLVEDDTTMRGLLKTLLEIEKFQAMAVESLEYEEIEKQMKSFNPDALLLDVHLHAGNGIEYLKNIRKIPAFQKTAVLMISGENLKSQCINAGANGFLLKPYMPDDLIRWIHENTGKQHE
jgi:DNA-binding response OmpR family regulator